MCPQEEPKRIGSKIVFYRERGKKIKIKMLKMPLNEAQINVRPALGLLVFLPPLRRPPLSLLEIVF